MRAASLLLAAILAIFCIQETNTNKKALAQSSTGPGYYYQNFTTPDQVQEAITAAIQSAVPQAVQAAVPTAVAAAMPAPATSMPPATALDGATGSAVKYARADHTHAARVQRTVITTATDGTYTWKFARPIICIKDNLPPITYMVEDTGSPVVVQIIGRTMTSDGVNDTHTAVTVKALRARALPATLVTVTPLVGFDIFGLPAPSVRVNLFAADPTQ